VTGLGREWVREGRGGLYGRERDGARSVLAELLPGVSQW